MSIKNLFLSIKKILKIENEKEPPEYGFSSVREWIDFKKKYIPYVVVIILLVGVIVTQSEVQRVKEIRSRAGNITPGQSKNFDPVGSFDEVSCSEGFSGWACDQNDYSQAISVDIYRDGSPGTGGQFVTRMNSNLQLNSNILESCGGLANHAFNSSFPENLKDGNSHTYYLYAVNIPYSDISSALLSGSPKTLVCY